MEKLSFLIDNVWGTMWSFTLRRMFRLGLLLIHHTWCIMLWSLMKLFMMALLFAIMALWIMSTMLCEVEADVVGDAHGHPHGWSGKKMILTNATLSGDVDVVGVGLTLW
jgi:hypothetical protein